MLRCNFLTKINTMNRDRDKTTIKAHNTTTAQFHNVGTLPPTSPISSPFHVPSSSGCTLPLWTSSSPESGPVTTTTTLPHTHTHTLSPLHDHICLYLQDCCPVQGPNWPRPRSVSRRLEKLQLPSHVVVTSLIGQLSLTSKTFLHPVALIGS